MALEVAGGSHVVLHCKIGSIRAQGLFDFGPRPDIELALLALRIGVERGGKGPLRRDHFAGEPLHGLSRALAEKLLAAALIGQRQQLQELCVVVQHLLEMRHQPALVHRVARKAAAEVIVNAALTHAIQRMLDRLEKARIAGCGNLGAPRRPPLTGSNILPTCCAAASSSLTPMVTLSAGRALSASRASNDARFCSIFFGSSRNR